MITSSHGTRRDKVVQRKRVKGTECTPWTFYGLVNHFSRRVDHVWIIVGGPSILDIVPRLELLEALGAGIINVLGVGDELRRRRSVGGRHFGGRTGRWFKRQRLTLLLSAHDRHALLWSSLPLPRSSSVRRLDKPQIFFSHSDPKPFGVWCYFYLHLTYPCSIFVTPCHPTHPYLLLPHFDFREPTQFSTIVSQCIHSIIISPYVYYWVMVCAQDLP